MVKSINALEKEFRQITPNSFSQWQLGKPVMPGGVIKGAYWNYPYPIYAKRAEDCYVWDLDGRRYLDFANHHTTTILGHSHPGVLKAVQKEVQKGLGLGMPTTLEAEMATEICSRFKSIDRVRFTNSGTEATLHVTRLVKALTGKVKVAKFEGAYHGSHDALEVSVFPPIDKAGPDDAPSSVAAWKGMAVGSEENVVVLPYNQPESVELILKEHQHEIAAVFYDGKPGIYDVPVEFTRFLRKLTKELGIIMVMDEIVSFRVGYSGYQGICGVEPDLTTFGKIVGGGLPVGAIGGKAKYMDVFDNTQGAPLVGQSGSFSGNSLTLAAGLATLRGLTPEVYQHLEELRPKLHNGLLDVFERFKIPCKVVSQGNTVSFYITDQPVTDFRSAAIVPDTELHGRLTLALLLKGHLIHGGLGMTISAPMAVKHLDDFLGALSEVLQEQD